MIQFNGTIIQWVLRLMRVNNPQKCIFSRAESGTRMTQLRRKSLVVVQSTLKQQQGMGLLVLLTAAWLVREMGHGIGLAVAQLNFGQVGDAIPIGILVKQINNSNIFTFHCASGYFCISRRCCLVAYVQNNYFVI